MHYLLVGYMFLFIHRPFEVWPWLGELRVERVYMLLTLMFWLIAADKRLKPNVQHLAYAALAAVVVACWAASPWADKGQAVVEDWFKILVFYGLLVTTVWDERGLRRVAVGFVAVTAVYLAHSFREYLGGRHVYRMGTPRMIGIDNTLSDPNSFGAGVVYALPFVPAFWRARVGGRPGRLAVAGLGGLCVLCVLLTGSRSSLLGLGVWAGMVLARRNWRHMLAGLAVLSVAAPVGYMALPEALQKRFETIVNPDAGPANAKVSGEGRIEGLLTGLGLWADNPLTGVGPGAWRPATGSYVESHNLYGQVAGELGTPGVAAFLLLLAAFWANYRRVAYAWKAVPEWRNDLTCEVAGAVGTAVLLLLFLGNFGHNLFRYSWVWYGGFLVIARQCMDKRLRDLAAGPYASDPDPADHLPDDWEAHAGHGYGGHPPPGRWV